MAGQHRKPTEASHNILDPDSEIDKTGDLVHSALVQTLGLLRTVVQRSNEAQRAMQIVVHLGSDHDLDLSLAAFRC